MSLDVIDAPYATHAWDEGGVLSQTVAVADEMAIRILVRAAPGETLAAVRRDYPGDDVEVSRIRRDRVCDRTSRRLEIRRPEVIIECIQYADGRLSEPGWDPATTAVVQSFRHAGLDVTARWEVPTDLRDSYRADEDRFFASLHCDPAGP